MTTEELNRPVSFAKWAESLASDPEVAEERRDAFRRAIMGYLKYLKERHVRASFASAKAYFDGGAFFSLQDAKTRGREEGGQDDMIDMTWRRGRGAGEVRSNNEEGRVHLGMDGRAEGESRVQPNAERHERALARSVCALVRNLL